MRGKITGALSLIGLAVLLKNPRAHDALNHWVENAARKLGAWIPGVGRLRRRPTKTNSETETEALPENRTPTPPAAGSRKRSPAGKRPRTGARNVAPRGKSKAKRVTAAAKDGE